MGAQYHSRQIREAWFGTFRTDGGLSIVLATFCKITTNCVQENIGGRRIKEISFLINLAGASWPLLLPSGFLCRRYRSSRVFSRRCNVDLSEIHRSFLIIFIFVVILFIATPCDNSYCRFFTQIALLTLIMKDRSSKTPLHVFVSLSVQRFFIKRRVFPSSSLPQR